MAFEGPRVTSWVREGAAGGKGKKPKPKQRVDKSGQEAIQDISKLNSAMAKLLRLHSALGDAKTDFSEAVKKAAEDSGHNAAVVRRLVSAKAGDNFDEVKRIVDQTASVFELVG